MSLTKSAKSLLKGLTQDIDPLGECLDNCACR
jgi:hypothetical protein